MPIRGIQHGNVQLQSDAVQSAAFATEVAASAIVPGDLHHLASETMKHVAEGLRCQRLLTLSYSSRERRLRGHYAYGFSFSGLADLSINIAEFTLAERALLSGRILTSDHGEQDLPAALNHQFEGQTILVPLLIAERPIAILIGQPFAGIATRSAGWQEQAESASARAALLVELDRTANAYNDEVNMRHARRDLGAAMLENRPFEEVCDMLLKAVCQWLRVEKAGLYVKDNSGAYQIAALKNVSAEYTQRIMRLRKPGPVIARAIATGLPYYARDVQNDTQFEPEARDLFREEGLSSILICALHHGETHSGALAIYPELGREFTPAEMSIFQSFADQAAIAVAARDLMQQQRDLAIMDERNRLAREMHDTVAQSLAALVLQIETSVSELDSGNIEAARSTLATAGTLARKGLEDTRRAVKGLSPASLDNQSAAEAIGELVRNFEGEYEMPAHFVLSGEEVPLQAEQSLALLRIAQEALTNVHKHSQAHRVRVGLRFGIDNVTLLVEDDGVGFDVPSGPAGDESGGYGLFGMSERVRLLDGKLDVDSTIGWGTRIQAVLPYRPAAVTSLVTPPAPATLQQAQPVLALPPYTSASTTRIRVLIADDHAIMRQGIRGILEATGEIEIVGEAADGAEATAEAGRLRPDVVLMDLQMPGVDGLAALRQMQQTLPDIPVVVLTTFQTQETVTEALTAGARGFMLKDSAPAHLLRAIRAAHRGEALLSSAVTETLAEMASSQSNKSDGIEVLNEREQEVLDLLAQGARNKDIAEALFIVPRTVEYHLANIYSKLGVSNRTEAVRMALGRGLVTPGSGNGRS